MRDGAPGAFAGPPFAQPFLAKAPQQLAITFADANAKQAKLRYKDERKTFCYEACIIARTSKREEKE